MESQITCGQTLPKWTSYRCNVLDRYLLSRIEGSNLFKEFDLEAYVSHARENGRPINEVSFPYVAKLVKQAVEYARSLGFQPAQGYDAIQHTLDGVDINECTESLSLASMEGRVM